MPWRREPSPWQVFLEGSEGICLIRSRLQYWLVSLLIVPARVAVLDAPCFVTRHAVRLTRLMLLEFAGLLFTPFRTRPESSISRSALIPARTRP